MAGRGRPGVAPQTVKREQYAALIARGVSFSEACRIVGSSIRLALLSAALLARTRGRPSGLRDHSPKHDLAGAAVVYD